jgi:hypothetical protein
MRIEVTAEDIAKGERDSCEACPIALAVRRAFGVAHVDVDSVRIIVDNCGDNERTFETPHAAEDFIGRFDYRSTEEDPPEPFAFDLDVTP